MRVLLPGYHWRAMEPCPRLCWGTLFPHVFPCILLRTLPVWAYLLSGLPCSAVVGRAFRKRVRELCFQFGGIFHSTQSSGTEFFLISTPSQGNGVPRVALFFFFFLSCVNSIFWALTIWWPFVKCQASFVSAAAAVDVYDLPCFTFFSLVFPMPLRGPLIPFFWP